MLKNDGRSRNHRTFVKCDNCKGRILLEDQEIIIVGKLKYIECPFCSQQIILKRN